MHTEFLIMFLFACRTPFYMCIRIVKEEKNMFIHSDDLFMFLIYPLIGAIAYIFALRYQLKEIKKELWEERDKVRELQEQLIKKQK